MLDIYARITKLCEQANMNQDQYVALLKFTRAYNSIDESNSGVTNEVNAAFRTLKDAQLFACYREILDEIKGK